MGLTAKEKLKLAAELEDVEFAVQRCLRAVREKAIISTIEAADEAESHRSIDLQLNAEESAAVFKALAEALPTRAKALKAQIEG